MARFLTDEDYFQIRPEILKLLDGSTSELATNYKLLKAENAAISQIKKRLTAANIDVDEVFSGIADERDDFIVMMAVDMTLYHLYSQSNHKDIPTQRETRYQDALDWLKDQNAVSQSGLPSIITDETPGEVRIWSDTKENHTW